MSDALEFIREISAHEFLEGDFATKDHCEMVLKAFENVTNWASDEGQLVAVQDLATTMLEEFLYNAAEIDEDQVGDPEVAELFDQILEHFQTFIDENPRLFGPVMSRTRGETIHMYA